MATVTLGGSGNWSSTTPNAPWPGGTLPGTSDDIIVPTGMLLTVDGNYTIGSGPDNLTTYVLDCQGTGMVTINDACTLTVKGNVRFNGGTNVRLTQLGTGRLYFDTSPRPTTKRYRILNSSAEFTLYMRGTDDSNRATIEADSGGYWEFERTAGGQRLGLLDIQLGCLKRMWDQATGISARGWRVNRNVAGVAATVNDLLMDTCGPIIMVDSGSGRSASFTKVRTINSPSSRFYGISWAGFGASNTGEMTHCVLDNNPNNDGWYGLLVNNCVYWNSGNGTLICSPSSANNIMADDPASGLGTGVIVGQDSSGNRTIKDHLMWSYTADINTHWVPMPGNPPTGTIDGIVFAQESLFNDGDLNNGPDESGAWTMRNCITTPLSNGNSPGVFFAPTGPSSTSTATVSFEYNAVLVNQYGVLHLGENGSLATRWATGGVPVFKSNMVVLTGDSVAGGAVIHFSTTNTSEIVTHTGVDDNWIFAGTAFDTAAENYEAGGGTQTVPTPTACESALYNVDPECIDRTRRMPTWAAWFGARYGYAGDGTTTPNDDATKENALLLIKEVWKAQDFTGEALVSLLLKYFRRGWIPTNAAGRDLDGSGRTPSPYGSWAPAVTIDTVSASGLTATTNDSTGDYYVVLVPDGDQPNWFQDVIDGLDGSLAAVPAANIFTGAVSSTTINVTFTGASLGGGDYRAVLVHVRDAPAADPTQEVWTRASEPVTSAAFQAAAGGRSKLTSSILRSITGSLLQAA